MKGKEKCKALKELRAKIAADNDIEYAVSECSHKGECLGTCPKCEAELRYLEKELEKKKKLGEAVAVVGLSIGGVFTMTGCSAEDVVANCAGGIVTPFVKVVDMLDLGGPDGDLGGAPEPLGGDTVQYSEPELDGMPTSDEPAGVDPDDFAGDVSIDMFSDCDDDDCDDCDSETDADEAEEEVEETMQETVNA